MTYPYPDEVQHSVPTVIPVSYLILITDETLQFVGDPISDWRSLDVTIKYNEPSSGLFTASAYPEILDQIGPGRRVVVMRYINDGSGYAGSVLIAGPIEQWLLERSDDGDNAGVGTLTVHFTDDLARVVARCTYPDPTLTPATQTTDSWTYTGNAETALRTLVNLNAGPGALQPRRIPQLVLGATAGVGTTVTVGTDRMQLMGDVMRAIATAGGQLGFKTSQVGTSIVFTVYAPTDLSHQVRFAFGLGNLKYVSYEVDAPKATTVIVGGQGEGADRFVTERNNTAEETAWGRAEELLSQPGTSTDLADSGDKELASQASTSRVSSNVADTSDQRYGVHYEIGDIVTVETAQGTEVSDQVLTVHVQAWPSSGEYVQATIGSEAAKTDPAWVVRLRDIEDRLGHLERNIVTAVVP